MASPYGIRIEYSESEKPIGTFRKLRTETTLNADFFIDTKPSSHFITSPVIHRTIKRYLDIYDDPVEFKRPLGNFNVAYDPLHTVGTWKNYFPFPFERERFFEKRGIALLLEEHFLVELKKRFPDLDKLIHISTRKGREDQMDKRDIDPFKYYSYDEALAKLRRELKRGQVKFNARENLAKTLHALAQKRENQEKTHSKHREPRK